MACVFVYTAGLQYGKAAFWIMVILKYDVVGPWSCWDDDKRKDKLKGHIYIYDDRPCLLILYCHLFVRYDEDIEGHFSQQRVDLWATTQIQSFLYPILK